MWALLVAPVTVVSTGPEAKENPPPGSVETLTPAVELSAASRGDEVRPRLRSDTRASSEGFASFGAGSADSMTASEVCARAPQPQVMPAAGTLRYGREGSSLRVSSARSPRLRLTRRIVSRVPF